MTKYAINSIILRHPATISITVHAVAQQSAHSDDTHEAGAGEHVEDMDIKYGNKYNGLLMTLSIYHQKENDKK